jgi:omega-hydroxy-beta-dihydromenaquinone-9 sulfotransferase
VQDGDDRSISVYNEMYDAYFEERGLIPEGRLCDVGYEELEQDPTGVVASFCEALGLTGFEEIRPRLESYLASIAGYRKNRLDGLPEPLRHRISQEWCRSFDESGYER